jgi:Family of unknown function (DUF6624)
LNASLRQELLAMAAEDQRVRAELAADGSLFDGYHSTMQAVHDKNAARLTEVIEQHGWPGRSLVGEEGSRAAWLVLQHAIAHPDLQRRGLVLLQDAVAQDEVPAVEAALLEDRIRFFEGRPQRYGTQFDWDESGQLSPLPIEDEANVDERRRSVGLEPLEVNTRRMRESIASSGEGPTRDWAVRQRKFVEWCRSVGWRK